MVSWVVGGGGGAMGPYGAIQLAGIVLAALWAAEGRLRGGGIYSHKHAYNTTAQVAWPLFLSLSLSFSLPFLFLFSPLVTAAGVVQGRMLSRLGVAWCLTAGPLVAACLMGATAVYPNTYMIGIGEIIRKVNAFAGVMRVAVECFCC